MPSLYGSVEFKVIKWHSYISTLSQKVQLQRKDGKGISAVEPHWYAERFQLRMKEVLDLTSSDISDATSILGDGSTLAKVDE